MSTVGSSSGTIQASGIAQSIGSVRQLPREANNSRTALILRDGKLPWPPFPSFYLMFTLPGSSTDGREMQQLMMKEHHSEMKSKWHEIRAILLKKIGK